MSRFDSALRKCNFREWREVRNRDKPSPPVYWGDTTGPGSGELIDQCIIRVHLRRDETGMHGLRWFVREKYEFQGGEVLSQTLFPTPDDAPAVGEVELFLRVTHDGESPCADFAVMSVLDFSRAPGESFPLHTLPDWVGLCQEVDAWARREFGPDDPFEGGAFELPPLRPDGNKPLAA